ncbi:TetR family transcriptional regulator [Streptomyces sp. NPDC008092]|uniref:TetR/AcrR family transcriptional regulator n=1 Tax=Streptomyces sp. NPDC008092 TaxID=3364808 RepID=UPI0036DFD815
MGRVSRAQAQENRQRVVATASRLFRERGTSVSVADLMKAAGLTHGGFYKQFASKEDLVGEAIVHAFAEQAAHSAMAFEEHTGEHTEEHEHAAARRNLIEDYLSVWHRDHPAEGCPVSGFAADLGREPEQAARSQQVYIDGVRNRAARLATGDDDGMAQLCTMVGALALARATRGNPISEELLQAARTALTDNTPHEPQPPEPGPVRAR